MLMSDTQIISIVENAITEVKGNTINKEEIIGGSCDAKREAMKLMRTERMSSPLTTSDALKQFIKEWQEYCHRNRKQARIEEEIHTADTFRAYSDFEGEYLAEIIMRQIDSAQAAGHKQLLYYVNAGQEDDIEFLMNTAAEYLQWRNYVGTSIFIVVTNITNYGLRSWKKHCGY